MWRNIKISRYLIKNGLPSSWFCWRADFPISSYIRWLQTGCVRAYFSLRKSELPFAECPQQWVFWGAQQKPVKINRVYSFWIKVGGTTISFYMFCVKNQLFGTMKIVMQLNKQIKSVLGCTVDFTLTKNLINHGESLELLYNTREIASSQIRKCPCSPCIHSKEEWYERL